MNDRSRRPIDPRQRAEAAFRSVTTPPVETAKVPKAAAIPGAKEQVTLRLDRDVLEAYQEGGPGWQDRINAALRKSIGA